MILEQTDRPAVSTLHGEQVGVTATAGQRFVIETSPGGGEVLDEDVPAGKVWTIAISVNIDERTA